jgi:hypothetical protein
MKAPETCYVWFGFVVRFSMQNKLLTKEFYAGVGSGNRAIHDFSTTFKRWPDQMKAQIGVRRLLRDLIKTTIAEKADVPCRRQLKALLADMKKN